MTPDQSRKPWARYRELSGKEWVDALNAFPVRPEHPLILTGGEPSIHKDFLYIAANLDGYKLDMTSNLSFDIDEFAAAMHKSGSRFETSFHTYHPKFMTPEEFAERAEKLRDTGIIASPVFSLLDLDEFPHFRDDEHDDNARKFIEIARGRGLQTQRNEFRGQHMGSPFNRQGKHKIDCTSSWVNFAPNGEIYNCQYHLEQGKDCFGNVLNIEDCKPIPKMGEFFSCNDFGFCDPCHENSGHGAFRNEEGQVFRRDAHDTQVYLQWMSPESIKEVAKRYSRQGDLEQAATSYLAAIGKESRPGQEAPASTWHDLGITFWEGGQKRKALAAVMHAIELGKKDVECLAAAIQLGRETELIDTIREDLCAYFSKEEIIEAEKAAMAAFL